MKMKLEKEYFYWAFFWIQVIDFFKTFSPYIIVDGFMRIYQMMNLYFIILFLLYLGLNLKRGSSDKLRAGVQWLLMLSMIVITGSYSFYIFSNPWLYQAETERQLILNEVFWPVTLIVITTVALFTMFKKRQVIERTYSDFWSTQIKNDWLIAGGVLLLSAVFTVVSSKLIPGIRREYFRLFQNALSIILLGILLYRGQSFAFLRKIYYHAFFSFSSIFVLEYLYFFVFTRSLAIEINEAVSTSVQLSVIFGAIASVVCIGSMVYLILQEKSQYLRSQK